MPLILLSQSPRRHEILAKSGIDFFPGKGGDEPPPLSNEFAEQYLQRATMAKLQTKEHYNSSSIFLAADTIVLFNHKILRKPMNMDDAKRMLTMLSGNSHEVKTGWVLKNNMHQFIHFAIATTHVFFKKFENKWIEEYVNSGKPLDKAGAYGIQDIPQELWTISGEYENVVGFPIVQFLKTLQRKEIRSRFLKF